MVLFPVRASSEPFGSGQESSSTALPGLVVVTGAGGRVGRAVARSLAKLDVTTRLVDLPARSWDGVHADLCLPGDAYDVLRGADAVVHLAGIPQPDLHPDHVVFNTNVQATFNVVTAAAAAGVKRVVYMSSETVYGLGFARHSAQPAYLPIDESHPTTPSDPYGLSKLVGEQILEAACLSRRMAGICLRPAWVLDDEEYAAVLGLSLQRRKQFPLWSYIDADDLAEAVVAALTVQMDSRTLRLNVAAPDNLVGEPLSDLAAARYPAVPVAPGAGGASGLDARLLTTTLRVQPRPRFTQLRHE